MRSTSRRECPNCLKIHHTSFGCDVMVVPYYHSHIKTSRDPLSLKEYHNLIITETYICPNCGEKITEEYVVGLTQEDMQSIVDREVANRK